MSFSTSSNRERVVAAVYCRISIAALADKTKVEDQEAQCREVCRRRGWEVGEVYVDNSRSAWQRTRKRPGWDAMLADIKLGRFGAIVSYWGDRLVRQPRDLEDLLDLRDVRQIILASVAGEYDFDNPDHRMMMRWEVARACNESDTISRRVTRHHAKRREQGLMRPGGPGGRSFGFATDGVTHIPAEVKVIHEAAERVLGGEAVGEICRDLGRRGIRNATGNPFSHHTLRKMLARPRYAGLMPDGESAGAWEPVLERDMWEAVVAALESKAAEFGYATNARKYLLSGIAVCGVCGAGLQIRAEHRRTHQTGYGCVRDGCRKVQRSVRLLDAYVIRRVCNRLSHEANPEGRAPSAPGLAQQFAALTSQRTEADAAIRDPGNGQHLGVLLARLENIDQRLAELRELAAGDARHRLLATHTGITEDEFNGLPLSVRRALVAACYTVTVLPASGRGPGFRPEDVRLTAR